MEDSKGDVDLVFSGGASQSPVVSKFPSETVLEDISGEKLAEESYDEGAGGEIMVEVVGSDVFVDGVSGHEERVLGSGEAGELRFHVWETQDSRSNVDAISEECVSNVEKGKMGPAVEELKHVDEKQDFGFVESVNSECGAVTEFPIIGIERAIESINILPSTTDSVNVPFEEATEQTCVVASEEMRIKDITFDKDSGNIVMPEILNCSHEAVVEGGSVADEEDTFQFGNGSTSCLDPSVADSVTAHEVANAGACGQDTLPEASLDTNSDGPEKVQVGGFDGVVDEVGLVSAGTIDPNAYISGDTDTDLDLTVSASDAAIQISEGKVSAAIISETEVSMANAESVSTNGDGDNGAKANEKDVTTAEKEHMISKLDAPVPNIQSENQRCVNDFNGINCDPTHGTHDISLESSQERSFVGKNEEVMSVDFDSVLDFKVGDLSCANDKEYLNPDGDGETTVVQEDLGFSNEPIQVVVEVGSPEINNDKVIKIGIQTVMEDNLPDTAHSSHAGEEEILEAGLGKYVNHPIIDMPDSEAIDDSKVAILQAKVVVRAESSDNVEDIDEGDIAKTYISDVSASNVEAHKLDEPEDCSRKRNDDNIVEGHISDVKDMDIEEREFGLKCTQVDCREPELGTDETASEAENSKFMMEELVKSTGSLRMDQSGYFSPPENEGEFSLFDLVWGKVRSYPWWPGQIYDPSDASEKAVKYFKKDSYLVAYFGDRTFTWNDASVLKPFRSNFSQIEKQSNSEAFQNAVNCALEEVSRRVGLGLACSCVSKDAYDNIKTQVVENTGIREESSQREGVDQSSGAACFEPNELLEFVKDLAPRASSGADRLDFVIAQAQLSAFCNFKGHRLPTEFPSSGELLENDADNAEASDEMVTSPKHKHIPKDRLQSRKERSLTELMGDAAYSPDYEDEAVAKYPIKSVSSSSGKKRKTLDPLSDESDKKVSVYAVKASTSTYQYPKPSFKIGECIRRVASQLTGSTFMIKGHTDETRNDGSPKINEHSERQNMMVSAESSLNEMLSQLQLLAQDPKKKHIFLNRIVTFFSGFRSSIALNRRGKKKKSAMAVGGTAEEFEFDDVNDSYWTDRIVQNYSEDQLLNNCENGAANLQVVLFDAEKSVKSGRKSHSRKRFSTGSYQTAAAAAEFDENVKRRKQESSPAELILNFAERDRVPSEINLNKMFRRFGPLMESETEVDHDSGRAKVIFKRGSDAEVAHNSAEKFNIFGPMLVNYEIGYSPLISVKILPVAVPQCLEDPTVML